MPTAGPLNASSAHPAFHIDVPVVAFEKADAPEGQRKRIAGIISTDGLDRQNERLLQDGLDFAPFLRDGHYTNEHTKGEVTDIVGYPDVVKKFKAGEKLPNGSTSPHACTWAEGFLIGKKGDEIYHLAKDMQGTPRRLAFSVEGHIKQRDPSNPQNILAASVQNCAITSHPCNPSCGLELLLRSLNANPSDGRGTLAEQAARSQTASHDVAKAYTLGTSAPGVSPLPTPNQPLTGEGMGGALIQQFARIKRRLKRRSRKLRKTPKTACSKSVGLPDSNISLNRAEAIEYLQRAVPGLSSDIAKAVYMTARALEADGR